MASITLYTSNILEDSTVTVTGTADTGKPESRLYDRAVCLFWKTTGTGAVTFHVDQGAAGDTSVDALIIDKHNFDGEDLTFEWSENDSDWTAAVTGWTQSGNGQIIKTLDAALTKRYWRVTVTSMTDPKCSEIFIGAGAAFAAGVVTLPVRRPMGSVQWNRTMGGSERSTRYGDERRIRQYTTRLQNAAGEAIFLAAMDNLDGTRLPFYLTDDKGVTFMVRLTEEPDESPAEATGAWARYELDMIEVL